MVEFNKIVLERFDGLFSFIEKRANPADIRQLMLIMFHKGAHELTVDSRPNTFGFIGH